MKQTIPWNVTGIPSEARDVARAAATREGVSVGDWLTRRILTESARSLTGSEARSEGATTYRHEDDSRRERDELMMRLARNEADTDSAFRRIDESLRTLTRRLESNERSQNEAQRAMSSAASEVSAATREQADAFVLLTQRIDRVEQGGDATSLRDAVRVLHQGLSRLTEQIARTTSESSEHIASLAGNLGAARDDLSRLEQSVDERLAVLSGRLDAVEQHGQAAGRIEETITLLESRITSAEERLQQALGQHLAAIERNLEGITTKLDVAERSGEEAQTLIRENLRHLSQGLETAERRSKDNWTEWKSGLTEATKRIESLEGKAPTQPRANSVTNSSAKAVPESDVMDELLPIEDELLDTDGTAPSSRPTVQDYLAQTRRAAEGAAADPLIHRGSDDATGRNRRALIMQVLLVLFVLAAGFLLMQSFGPRPEASRPATVNVPAAALTGRLAPGNDASGRLSLPGAGTDTEALNRLQATANAGDAKAALLLGVKYADGDGVATNDREAFRWLQKAAQSGEAIAQYRLATLFERGRGVTADSQQAAALYEQAAKGGNRRAMHNLAVAYANGAGREKNFTEAARWFRAAADLGLPDAQFNLAVLYERGLGVRTSLADAYKWYAIAAAAGDAESQARAGALATQIPPAEREAADGAASDFKLAPLNREANDVPSDPTISR